MFPAIESLVDLSRLKSAFGEARFVNPWPTEHREVMRSWEMRVNRVGWCGLLPQWRSSWSKGKAQVYEPFSDLPGERKFAVGIGKE